MDLLNPDRVPRVRPHTGIDIIAPSGHPVLAAADGVVVVVTTRSDVGLNIILDHGRSQGEKRLYTFYGHLSRIDVEPGQAVARGSIIGAVGATGSLMPASRTPHLHFEVMSGNGKPIVRTTASGETYLARVMAEDPHPLWFLENGHIASFDERTPYPQRPLRLTYPVLCRR